MTKGQENGMDRQSPASGDVSGIDALRSYNRGALSRGFITAESGDGNYCLRIKFASLTALRAGHDALIWLAAKAHPEAAQAEPTLTVTACYFPAKGEADLSWERDGKTFAMTAKVTPEQGKALSNVVWPCINWAAAAKAEPLPPINWERVEAAERGDKR